MKTQNKWSKSWNTSIQPRKQRTFVRNAPLHVRSSFLCSHLCKELMTKHKMRSIRVKKGDKVKVMRGQFKNKIGKIERVSVKRQRLFITGVEQTKMDKTKALYPIHPSNVLVMELDLNDKRRLEEKK